LHGGFGIILFDVKTGCCVTQMAIFSFKTIKQKTEGFYKEKGSKFIAFAMPVKNEVEIKTQLEELRKEYFDARHHCYAWMLGAEKNKFRSFDDGEPNHSAGDPILGQIKSKGLTNILIVVIRYFGGTKLGVGGLVVAYKAAAVDALEKATIIEEEIKETLRIVFAYSSTPEVMKLIKDFDLTITQQSFEKECEMILEYNLINKEALLKRIELLKATGTDLIVQPVR
jgi:uncharacterized YigZ family protein